MRKRAGAREPRTIGDVARALLRRKKFREKGRYGALVDAWQELTGEEIAARTQIRSFKDGELVIEVESSVLLHELNGFLKEQHDAFSLSISYSSDLCSGKRNPYICNISAWILEYTDVVICDR